MIRKPFRFQYVEITMKKPMAFIDNEKETTALEYNMWAALIGSVILSLQWVL